MGVLRYCLMARDDERLRDATPKTRLVLQMIALRLGSDGAGCWPSVATIEADTGLSRRAVQYALTEAEEAGFLTRTWRGGRSNVYDFPKRMAGGKVIYKEGGKVIDNGGEGVHDVRTPEGAGGARGAQGGCMTCAGGCAPLAPITIPSGTDTKEPLSLSKASGVRTSCTPRVDNSGWDGTTKPRTAEEKATVERWCREAGLTAEKTMEFLNINNLAGWRMVSVMCSVRDLVAGFVARWRKERPDEWAYERERRREAARAAELSEAERRVREEGKGEAG